MKLKVFCFPICIVLLFLSCASSQLKLSEGIPLEIEEYYYQTWAAGAIGAGSGINFTVAFKSAPKQIQIEALYFRDGVTSLVQKPQAPSVFVAYFRTSLNTSNDIIMSSDTNEEFGNKAPKIKASPTNPFNLNATEAVLSYIKDKKVYYYKLTQIEERPTRQPPIKIR